MEQQITGYAILVEEPGVQNYILTDGYRSLGDAKLAMKHRAEEFIDELAATDAEQGHDVEAVTLEISKNELEVRVLGAPDRGMMGRIPELMHMTITTVVLR